MSAEAPEVAETVFGDRLGLAIEYASLLETEGVVRGLIGPREAPRLWDRHLLNCAVVSELISEGATVIDVGSGAGLPGIVLAVARPDISVILVEPLARRTAFLDSAVAVLGLDRQVTVVRGRAEEQVGRLHAAVVTARAVASLDRLGRWCLPLADLGGRMLALKGASAGAEIDEHQEALRRLGGGRAAIRLCGVGMIEPPTTVVEVVHERAAATGGGQPRRGSGSRSGSHSGSGQVGGSRPGGRPAGAQRSGSGQGSGSTGGRRDDGGARRDDGGARRDDGGARRDDGGARRDDGGWRAAGGSRRATSGEQRSTSDAQPAAGGAKTNRPRSGGQKPGGPERKTGRGRRQG